MAFFSRLGIYSSKTGFHSPFIKYLLNVADRFANMPGDKRVIRVPVDPHEPPLCTELLLKFLPQECMDHFLPYCLKCVHFYFADDSKIIIYNSIYNWHHCQPALDLY